MHTRNKEGATLALTVTAIFFIVILGVGLFFLVQLLGGGREAQHATDAGNLNVAKQALLHPSLSAGVYSDPTSGQSINESVEFAGLLDQGNQINLANYNRLVGKAFLVAANASAEGTPAAYQNAQAVLNAVEGQGGIGQRLTAQLSSGGGIASNFFDFIAHSNSLRMANWNQQNQINNDFTHYKVAYLRQNQNAPTNLQLINNGLQNQQQYNVIPQGAVITTSYAASSSTSQGQSYLVGYSPITVKMPGVQKSLTIYGVPLRPGLQPHTVSQAQFGQEQTSPVALNGTSLLPPNAFQSQSYTPEMHGGMLSMRSSAIVGSLNMQYPLSIPSGYIAINNSGPTLGQSTQTNGLDIFAGELMYPGVYIMTAQPSGMAYFTAHPNDYSAISGAQPTGQLDSNGNKVVTANLGGTSFQPSTPSGNDLDSLYAQLKGNNSPTNCNNTNSFSNSPGNCASLVGKIQNELLQGGPNQPGTSNYSNLMAIEWVKAKLIDMRGSFDGFGCGTFQGNPPCTGLKGYSVSAVSGTNNISFGNSAPTLSSLLNQAGDSGQAIYKQVVQRLYEMNPNATAGDISNAMNQAVSFLAVPLNSSAAYQYLFWNGHSFVISSSPPAGVGSSPNVTPDGSTLAEHVGPVQVKDQIVDVNGDGGYPHPFDCEPPAGAQDLDQVKWTPSSGLGNLLGVLQFQNCASVGAKWCCPC